MQPVKAPRLEKGEFDIQIETTNKGIKLNLNHQLEFTRNARSPQDFDSSQHISPTHHLNKVTMSPRNIVTGNIQLGNESYFIDGEPAQGSNQGTNRVSSMTNQGQDTQAVNTRTNNSSVMSKAKSPQKKKIAYQGSMEIKNFTPVLQSQQKEKEILNTHEGLNKMQVLKQKQFSMENFSLSPKRNNHGVLHFKSGKQQQLVLSGQYSQHHVQGISSQITLQRHSVKNQNSSSGPLSNFSPQHLPENHPTFANNLSQKSILQSKPHLISAHPSNPQIEDEKSAHLVSLPNLNVQIQKKRKRNFPIAAQNSTKPMPQVINLSALANQLQINGQSRSPPPVLITNRSSTKDSGVLLPLMELASRYPSTLKNSKMSKSSLDPRMLSMSKVRQNDYHDAHKGALLKIIEQKASEYRQYSGYLKQEKQHIEVIPSNLEQLDQSILNHPVKIQGPRSSSPRIDLQGFPNPQSDISQILNLQQQFHDIQARLMSSMPPIPASPSSLPTTLPMPSSQNSFSDTKYGTGADFKQFEMPSDYQASITAKKTKALAPLFENPVFQSFLKQFQVQKTVAMRVADLQNLQQQKMDQITALSERNKIFEKKSQAIISHHVAQQKKAETKQSINNSVLQLEQEREKQQEEEKQARIMKFQKQSRIMKAQQESVEKISSKIMKNQQIVSKLLYSSPQKKDKFRSKLINIQLESKGTQSQLSVSSPTSPLTQEAPLKPVQKNSNIPGSIISPILQKEVTISNSGAQPSFGLSNDLAKPAQTQHLTAYDSPHSDALQASMPSNNGGPLGEGSEDQRQNSKLAKDALSECAKDTKNPPNFRIGSTFTKQASGESPLLRETKGEKTKERTTDSAAQPWQIQISSKNSVFIPKHLPRQDISQPVGQRKANPIGGWQGHQVGSGTSTPNSFSNRLIQSKFQGDPTPADKERKSEIKQLPTSPDRGESGFDLDKDHSTFYNQEKNLDSTLLQHQLARSFENNNPKITGSPEFEQSSAEKKSQELKRMLEGGIEGAVSDEVKNSDNYGLLATPNYKVSPKYDDGSSRDPTVQIVGADPSYYESSASAYKGKDSGGKTDSKTNKRKDTSKLSGELFEASLGSVRQPSNQELYSLIFISGDVQNMGTYIPAKLLNQSGSLNKETLKMIASQEQLRANQGRSVIVKQQSNPLTNRDSANSRDETTSGKVGKPVCKTKPQSLVQTIAKGSFRNQKSAVTTKNIQLHKLLNLPGAQSHRSKGSLRSSETNNKKLSFGLPTGQTSNERRIESTMKLGIETSGTVSFQQMPQPLSPANDDYFTLAGAVQGDQSGRKVAPPWQNDRSQINFSSVSNQLSEQQFLEMAAARRSANPFLNQSIGTDSVIDSLAKQKPDEDKEHKKMMRKLRKGLKQRRKVVSSIVNSNIQNLRRYHSQLKYYEKLEDYQDTLNRQVAAQRAQSILNNMDRSQQSLEQFSQSAESAEGRFDKLRNKTHVLSNPKITSRQSTFQSPRAHIVESKKRILMEPRESSPRGLGQVNEYPTLESNQQITQPNEPVFIDKGQQPSIVVLPDIDAKKTRLQKLARISKIAQATGILKSGQDRNKFSKSVDFTEFSARKILQGDIDKQVVKLPVFDAAAALQIGGEARKEKTSRLSQMFKKQNSVFQRYIDRETQHAVHERRSSSVQKKQEIIIGGQKKNIYDLVRTESARRESHPTEQSEPSPRLAKQLTQKVGANNKKSKTMLGKQIIELEDGEDSFKSCPTYSSNSMKNPVVESSDMMNLQEKLQIFTSHDHA